MRDCRTGASTALCDAGEIEQLGRGLFRRRSETLFDLGGDLAEPLARAPDATLCLVSALRVHGLTDLVPDAYDLALPRGRRRHPVAGRAVHWHSFDHDTFAIGRVVATVSGITTMHVYDAPRTIVDAYRMGAKLGHAVAHEALRRWLAARGEPADVIAVARQLPAALPSVRNALEVLLS